jgi:hypothetical protein
MAKKTNTISPGRGQVGKISNKYRSGKFNTFTSETSGNRTNSRPGNKVQFEVI